MISFPKKKEGEGPADGGVGRDEEPKKQNRFKNSGGALLSDMPKGSSRFVSLGTRGIVETAGGVDSCLLEPSAGLDDMSNSTNGWV